MFVIYYYLKLRKNINNNEWFEIKKKKNHLKLYCKT